MNKILLKTSGLKKCDIYNMDETPCYFDMNQDRTLHFKGAKTVDGLDTGSSKKRFTSVLCISASGKFIRTLIIFKGLKKKPKLKLSKNIDVEVSDGGSMNRGIMMTWIKNCFKARTGVFQNKALLIMDSFKSHFQPEIIQYLEKSCKTDVIAIPPKGTSYLQPLDVSINFPFKQALRSQWSDWFATSTPEFTKSGYRKRPSYQNIVDFVAAAIEKITPSVIERAFECCGVGEMGEPIPGNRLNSKLKNILEVGETGDNVMLVNSDDEDEYNIFVNNEEGINDDEDYNIVEESEEVLINENVIDGEVRDLGEDLEQEDHVTNEENFIEESLSESENCLSDSDSDFMGFE